MIPEKFLLNMRVLLKDEYDAFEDSLKKTSYSGFRVNTLKVSPEKLKTLLDGVDLRAVKWCAEGFYFDCPESPDYPAPLEHSVYPVQSVQSAQSLQFGGIRLSKLPYYQAGLYYIQEPSAMSPAAVLPVEENERILDICAAPGGKTVQLAAKLGGTGVIVSNDVSASRCIALGKNISLMGIKNAVVTNEPSYRLIRNFAGWFDKILVDAPCSGEGMFRKDTSASRGWLEHGPNECSIWQKNILDDAAVMLRDGGLIMYSTCTFNPTENELVIQDFLNCHSDFEIIPINHEKYGLNAGRGDWAGNDSRLCGCARIWPHKNCGEGHFLALLGKKIDTPNTNPVSPADVTFKPVPNAAKPFLEFCEVYLKCIPYGNIILRKNALYIEPYDMPDISGIRAYKTGLYAGDIKNGRFVPSTSLALALKKDEFTHNADFPNQSDDIRRYLNGESFDVDMDDGYCLVSVDGFSLGFGKVVSGRMKNRRM